MKTIQLRNISIAATVFLLSLAARGQGTFIYDQQSALEGAGGEGAAGIQNNQPIGQSFTPTLSSVGFIRLNLGDGAFNGFGATVYVNLRANSITGTILASSSTVFMPDRFSGYPDFFFATPVTVTPGLTYYFQPVVQSGDVWAILGDSHYDYLGGIAFANGAALPNTDWWFREGIVDPVPEPSSIALFSLGLGALVCLRRVKNTTLDP